MNQFPDAKALFSAIATLLTFVAFVPYYLSIWNRRVRPHVFSWFIWGGGTMIVFFAQLAGGGGIRITSYNVCYTKLLRLTPAFMEGRKIKRAAVLLPFSHPNAQVRAEAESMLAGIELALFEYAGDDFLIIPKDTAGKQSVAEARIDEAVKVV